MRPRSADGGVLWWELEGDGEGGWCRDSISAGAIGARCLDGYTLFGFCVFGWTRWHRMDKEEESVREVMSS